MENINVYSNYYPVFRPKFEDEDEEIGYQIDMLLKKENEKKT